jgi:hypothetical protein
MQVIVYRGHSVVTPLGTYGPGGMVDLPDAEALRLIERGVVHRPGETVTAYYTADARYDPGRMIPRDDMPGSSSHEQGRLRILR